MAKINDTATYPNTAPARDDHLPGTDVSNTGNSPDGETVTFKVSDLLALIEAGDLPAHTHNDSVTNARLADMATARIKGRNTSGTGDPEDLTGAQVLGIIGVATAGEIAGLSGSKPITPDGLGSLYTATIPSGGSNYAPDFATTRVAGWTPTANRVFSNPTNPEPGETIMVELYASSATERTITFGSNYVGDLPTLKIKSTVGYAVFITCVTSTKFVVSAKKLQS